MNFLLSGIGPFFKIDLLSLFFSSIIVLVYLPSLIYSFGYLKHFSSSKRFSLQLITLGFVLSMLFLTFSNNALVFLIFWEMMSLLSYFLVLAESENQDSVNAASIYIIMTHCGTAFLLAAFCYIYSLAGTFDLAQMTAACHAMKPIQLNALFFCFLIGFGTKAGIVPLHIWLPYAHPQAPSHISSLMSGVMIKMAIFGFIRFVFLMLGINSLSWGIILLVLALISCLVGILYALIEKDLKRLLAYCSVENIGIILIGLSISMICYSLNLTAVAGLALIASLYHLLNHAVLKGLLFLCAGSVQKGTGELDIEKLGGLARKMPWTSAFFLIGAVGISALPPLNGFISEWLTLRSIFLGAVLASGKIKLILGLSAAALALTSGLAAACFVKAFGITFLALPRSEQAKNAKEADRPMLIGMGLLAGAAVFLGLGTRYIVKGLSRISESIFLTNQAFPLQDHSYLSIPLLISSILAASVLIVIAIYFVFSSRKWKTGTTWDCGYYKLDSHNEYTATAFSKPFRISFSFFLLPFRNTSKVRDSLYHVKSFVYETYTTKVFKKYLYDAGLIVMLKTARLFKRAQAGSIHLYIAYISGTLLLLLLLLRFF